MSLILTGAHLKVYINNKLIKEVQEISYDINYDESEIRGIDCPFPQEIAAGRASVSGSIRGIKIKNSGGIQAYNIRPLIKDILSSPYISIRVQDRQSKEDLLFVQNAKVVSQNMSASIKGVVRISFNFKGLVAFEPLDR